MATIIISTHARERIANRRISLTDLEQTITHPDFRSDQADGKVKFGKTITGRKHQVVATFLEQQQAWLIISAWVRGEEDRLPLVWLLISWPFRLAWQLTLWLLQRFWQLSKRIFAKSAGKK